MTERSMYEQFNPLTTVAKQRFVELFQRALDTDRWSVYSNTGTITAPMSDVINGGCELTTNTTSNAEGGISFGTSVRQYSNVASTVIWGFRLHSTTDVVGSLGLKEDEQNFNTNFQDAYGITFDNSQSAFRLRSGNASSNTNVSMLVTKDTLPHIFKGELASSNLNGYLDGILKNSKTNTLPTGQMSPRASVGSVGTLVKKLQVNYCEAWNV